MEHQSGSFHAFHNLELFYQSWQPDQPAKAACLIVHGFGEHSGRYPHLVQHLVLHGYAVFSFDQRGHGRSPGQRGHINDWIEYREDLRAFVNWVRQREPDLPVFLFGHSMGAVTVLEYALFYADTVDGVIAQGTPIEPVGIGSPFLVKIASLLSRWTPAFPLPLYIDPDALSHDPAVGPGYKDDPLVHGKTSARWGTEVLAALERVKAQAVDLHIPILLLHGGSDPLNAPHGAQTYFDSLSLEDKTLRIYPGFFHELHNEIDHFKVMEDLTTWLDLHVGEARQNSES